MSLVRPTETGVPSLDFVLTHNKSESDRRDSNQRELGDHPKLVR